MFAHTDDVFEQMHRRGFVIRSRVVRGCVEFTGHHHSAGAEGPVTVTSAGPLPRAIDAAARELSRRLGPGN